MNYSEIIASNEFKQLQALQNTEAHSTRDILTICGFMAGLPDAKTRLTAHLKWASEAK